MKRERSAVNHMPSASVQHSSSSSSDSGSGNVTGSGSDSGCLHPLKHLTESDYETEAIIHEMKSEEHIWNALRERICFKARCCLPAHRTSWG